ncbi:amidohydrolase [Aspergillus saccharolyticus JOP 1030-1]|uniref:Amidohydrolase 3 n=1 Tax=Aspergillus saccharolyticus JOP 1030-1 TaxID=1450539 RepID=A0A318ZXQ7_9EURO|nr:amidohydrolase 3 [Aspergillus saccharolyticus JOP 1030-1]PYH49113.1 amidohydrolase 3 [Aspergillus saccharolyticus JOP 1030-1]
MTTVFRNCRVFAPSSAKDGHEFANGMIIDTDQISYVGSLDEADIPNEATVIDLDNRIVIPGFIDAHVHILKYGHSLRKVNLIDCTSLQQIRETIKAYAAANPSAPYILCRGWIQSSTKGIAIASMLDDLDSRPILIDSLDLHSMWCNSAALDKMQAHTASDPPGGTIHRDEHGRASGLLDESAVVSLAWPFVETLYSTADKISALDTAVFSYTAAGYTGVVDMAMDEDSWSLLEQYRQEKHVPFHIAAHWLVPFSDDQQAHLRFVDRAIELNRQYRDPTFTIVGIKLICDGVVDGCTAALQQPYSGKLDPVEPIWPANMLREVVQRADAAGLQCAIHAIGDKAIHQAINVLAEVGSPGRRHRIEHLELSTSEDAKRLGELGITASVQPVHSDPALFKAWPGLNGPERCKRAFAYKEFLDGGAPLAIGTDAPTARHSPFPNLYNATTRRSALELGTSETVNPHFGLSLAEAATAATTGAAYARFAEKWTGSLKEGLSADFLVVDMQWTSQALLEAKVLQTWYRGKKVYDAGVGSKRIGD